MLRLFEVEGFKNFKERFTLNFSDVRDYKFNGDCLTAGLIGKMIIYGKNAIGKSNFGLALFDIASYPYLRRTSPIRAIDEDAVDVSYLNTENPKGYAAFRYVFQFGDRQVEYSYRKNALQRIIYEKVLVCDELLFEYDRAQPQSLNAEGIQKISPTLRLEFENVDSVFRYVISNTPLEDEHPLRRTVKFIDEMRISSNIYGNSGFLASRLLPGILTDELILKEFEDFLHNAGVADNLTVLADTDGRKRLYFDTTPPLLFEHAASSGTKMLLTLFRLYKAAEMEKISLLFLDEFDAFYHFELAENIVQKLEKLKDTQIIFTSHNTNLLSNRIMRPDCYFILTKDKLTSFANATDRELREGHNLEKLFMSGEFDE